jgi:hypothetical protein
MEFKFDRPVRFEDLESSFSLVTEPASVRDEYFKQLQQFLELMRAGCHEFRTDYRQVIIDKKKEKVLADFLVERARSVAMGAGA